MKVRNNIKLSHALLAVNAILFFIIAFQIGGRLATAQSSYKVNSSSPYTAQYPEFKDQLSTTVTPETPGPNQDVSISVAVYSFDINSANITWKQNGRVVQQGTGLKSFKFTTGNSGVTTKIEVTIDPRDRPILREVFTFSPSEVDLLWQADTYSHPFYKGKNLYTPEASVLVVAMARSKSGIINPRETVFNWTENYTRHADKSGLGKNTYSFDGPIILRPTDINVETYSPKSGSNIKETATSDISITPLNAGVLMYEDNPAQGILFNKALLGTVTLNKSEIKVAAYPYFQTAANKNTNVEYIWAIDGYRANIAPEQNSIILKKTGGDKGESSVVVQSSNPFKILQTVTSGISIKFDNNVSSGFGN